MKIVNGTNDVLLVKTKDLFQLCDYAFKKAMDEAKQEKLSEHDQLKPVDYWVRKLQVDRTTIWRWEKAGKIHAVRMGGKPYYKATDFYDFGKEAMV